MFAVGVLASQHDFISPFLIGSENRTGIGRSIIFYYCHGKSPFWGPGIARRLTKFCGRPHKRWWKCLHSDVIFHEWLRFSTAPSCGRAAENRAAYVPQEKKCLGAIGSAKPEVRYFGWSAQICSLIQSTWHVQHRKAETTKVFYNLFWGSQSCSALFSPLSVTSIPSDNKSKF